MTSETPFHFFAYISRMKLIDRWSLMRCFQRENVQEHSLQVAVIAHALCLIANKYFGGNFAPERVALYAIFHDATEVLTGDLPTPVKYFNAGIREAYKEIEAHSVEQLMNLLPEDFRDEYRGLFLVNDPEPRTKEILKAADTLSAYIKCVEEETAGNNEFSRAKKSIEDKVERLRLSPEVDYFIKNFIPGFAMNLDEISQQLESGPEASL